MTRVIVVCGLPGSGKTTLASALAAQIPAAHLRVDAIETPLTLASIDVGPLGYQVVQEVAASNLALGIQVVVDLVDPLPETRRLWRDARQRIGYSRLELIGAEASEHGPDPLATASSPRVRGHSGHLRHKSRTPP